MNRFVQPQEGIVFIAKAVRFVGAEWDEEKHPRDEKGRWTTTYHGTSAAAIESIQREGIKLDKFGLVFTTPSLLEARTYARDKGEDVVVFEVKVPASLKRSSNPLHASGVYVEPIKPEWVKIHSRRDAKTGNWIES